MRSLLNLRALITLPIAGAITILVLIVTGAVPALALVVSYDYGREPWKTPTRIYSTVDPDEPFAKVYGPEWRQGDPVELGSLPPHVAAAFLAAEDARFRSHFGLDMIGIIRAGVANVRSGDITQGGSTISQQVVKARYLSADRTWTRKFQEALWAIALEKSLTKDQILEIYLNDVYLGHRSGRAVLGLDEAASVYFDREPAKLTPAQAALLAAIVRAPNRDTPDRRPEVAKRRRDAVLREMAEREWISESARDEALATRARFSKGGGFPGGELAAGIAAIRRETEEHVGKRKTRRGGLDIWTTLDPAMQRQAERAVRETRASLARSHSWIRRTTKDKPLQAALLSVEPKSGGVRAIVTGASPRDPFDRTSRMFRQPGSAFKTFVYLAAIARREVTPVSFLMDEPLKVELESGGTWEPRNYDSRFRGKVTVREAFERSLNIPAVRLMEDVGSGQVIRLAKRSGFEEDFPDIPALPLGVIEVSLRELTAAYTLFPNLGVRTEPFLISRIANRKGRKLYEHDREDGIRVVEAAPAYVTHSMLRGVVKRGTASRLQRYGLGFAAGKTGTTNDYRDAWFVGYAKDLVTTVWVGFDDATPLRLSSSEAALPLWGRYMSRVDVDRGEIIEPEGIVWRRIDTQTGLLWRDGCSGDPRVEVFVEGTQPRKSCPRGFFGGLFRRVLENDSYEEPPAISLEQVREFTDDVDEARRELEGALERVRGVLRRLFGDD